MVEFDDDSLSCVICYNVLYQPVRWPTDAVGMSPRENSITIGSCAHVFCRNCVVRCCATRPLCPVCRAPAPTGICAEFIQTLPIDALTTAAIAAHLPDVHAANERRAQREAEALARSRKLMLYPLSNAKHLPRDMTSQMSLYEPRYIWMLARALASPNGEFGMCGAARYPSPSRHTRERAHPTIPETLSCPAYTPGCSRAATESRAEGAAAPSCALAGDSSLGLRPHGSLRWAPACVAAAM